MGESDSDRTELRADLSLGPQVLDGALFVRWRDLSAAVRFESGERDWKLLGSRSRYEQLVAARRPGTALRGACD